MDFGPGFALCFAVRFPLCFALCFALCFPCLLPCVLPCVSLVFCLVFCRTFSRARARARWGLQSGVVVVALAHRGVVRSRWGRTRPSRRRSPRCRPRPPISVTRSKRTAHVFQNSFFRDRERGPLNTNSGVTAPCATCGLLFRTKMYDYCGTAYVSQLSKFNVRVWGVQFSCICPIPTRIIENTRTPSGPTLASVAAVVHLAAEKSNSPPKKARILTAEKRAPEIELYYARAPCIRSNLILIYSVRAP